MSQPELMQQRVREIQDKSQKVILVTGSSGFIGSNLCRLILQETKHLVVSVDAMKTGSHPLNTEGLDPSRFIEFNLDILDGELYKYLDEWPIDVVIHLCAESHVDRSIESSNSFWETNVLGTNKLLQYCVDRCHPIVINQLTDECYGPTVIPVKEGTRFKPTSPYAASKTAQYYVGRSFLETYNLPVISTFPCNTFGPRQYPEKLIPKFLLKLFRGEKVPLMASTHFMREWLFVDDHCRALLHLMNHGIPGEDYNIGPGYRCTNWELTKQLLELTGRDKSYIEIVPDRQAHDCSYSIDIAKLWASGFSFPEKLTLQERFQDNLDHTYIWYLDNYKRFYESSREQ